MERRLATIMMGDIVGYSRLMGLDEARLFERAHGRQVDLETTFSVRDLAAHLGTPCSIIASWRRCFCWPL